MNQSEKSPLQPSLSLTPAQIIAATHEQLVAVAAGKTGLNLTPNERRICYLLFEGYSQEEIAADIGGTPWGIVKYLQRARNREHCHSTLDLVCRYVHEYLGVGDACGERAVPERVVPVGS